MIPLKHLSRRRLLQGFGAIAATAPFLSRIPSVHAGAQPVRFVAYLTTHDTMPKRAWDPGVGSGAALPARLPSFLEPLSPHRQKLVMLGELIGPQSGAGTHEGFGCQLSGAPGGGSENAVYGNAKSLDQILAERAGQRPHVAGFVDAVNPLRNYASWAAPRVPNEPELDPRRAFTSLFGSAPRDAEETARVARRRSVLDAVAGELRAVDARLPVEDRFQLDAHLTGIRELERQLDAVAVECAGEAPRTSAGFSSTDNARLPERLRLHTLVAVQAMRCDLRRSFVLQYGGGSGHRIRPVWPSDGINIDENAHEIAHAYYDDAAGVRQRLEFETWQMRVFASLLAQMDAVDEGGSTLLDNSVVLWSRPMGKGHTREEMFHLLAGGAGGRMRRNLYLDYAGSGRTINDLLTTCAQLAGYRDITEVGTPSRNRDALPLFA